MTDKMDKIKVTTEDLLTGESASRVIMDDFALITAGSAVLANVSVHDAGDGTETHLIMVRGVRR